MTMAKAGAWSPSPLDECASLTIPRYTVHAGPHLDRTRPTPATAWDGPTRNDGAQGTLPSPFVPRFACGPVLRPGRGQMGAVWARTRPGATRRYPFRYVFDPLLRPATVERLWAFRTSNLIPCP